MKTLLSAISLLLAAAFADAGEKMGYLEDFALASDRSATLVQLVPGTVDFYYYKALDAQNRGDLDATDATLKQWLERHGRSSRIEEIQNRQALLRYSQDPKASLNYLRNKLGLRFNHRPERPGAKPDLPTALDSRMIAPETLLTKVRDLSKTLAGVEPSGLRWVLRSKVQLMPAERRDLLGRLERPDVPHLVELILSDLETKESRGFGEFEIHRNLFKDQLDEMRRRKPDLIHDEDFVRTYITRLRPPGLTDADNHNETRRAWLERLWDFATQLPQSQNSLKASLFYQRLVFDREEGIYDRERFFDYIRLPREVAYIPIPYLREKGGSIRTADLSKSYADWQLFPPIGTDEELVCSYLEHFFLTEGSYAAYQPFIREDFLKRVFAETKILNGIGDPEKWVSMLRPSEYQALKKRVDLEFAYTNPQLFTPGQPVSLRVGVKNVRKLIIKVYRVNTLNYYLKNEREIGTDLDLDGLIANQETTHEYSEPPLRRVARTFDFPELKGKRGTWVIEFIGNGRSSRALVRKGKLYSISRTGAAGTVLTVFNEKNERVPNASAWFGGREFKADEDGEIGIPFTAETARWRDSVILKDAEVARRDSISPTKEDYDLAMGVYANREQLLAGAKARVAIRPRLTVGGVPIDPTILEDATLTVKASTLDGISTLRTFADFELFAEKESIAEFQIPRRVRNLTFRLGGQVKKLGTGRKVSIFAEQEIEINGIDATPQIKDVFLNRDGESWTLEVLGRSGESRADQVIQVELKHRDFAEPVHVSLKTDGNGRVKLGALPGIVNVAATAGGFPKQWPLRGDRHSVIEQSQQIIARAGEAIRIPYMGAAETLNPEELSLLEWRLGYYADRFDRMTLRDSYIEITDLGPGRYDLFVRGHSGRVAISVIEGETRGGYVFGEILTAEIANVAPLQIQSIKKTGETIEVALANVGSETRVQVSAERFTPPFDMFQALEGQWSPVSFYYSPVESFYVSGRDIGDEYRYVLERAYAQKFPGNLLSRPGLLLNPWALRETETGMQTARAGEAYDRRAQAESEYDSETLEMEPAVESAVSSFADFSDLEFLETSSRVLFNLEPDEDGIVRLKVADLGGRHHLHVVAIDEKSIVCREKILDGLDEDFRDVRLAEALGPKQHFIQDKTITPLKKGEKLELEDPGSAEFEVYDTLRKLFDLYRTLNADSKIGEFSFIKDWPSLKTDEKREKYSKYACHELSFFLSLRDPEFFKAVIEPYLRNKKDKTFLDLYLLGGDLTKYLDPWEHARLNVLERILLGRLIEGEMPSTRRQVQELRDLIPPQPERYDVLFESGLRGLSMTEDRAVPGREMGSLRQAGGRLFDDADFAKEGVQELVPPMAAPGMPQSESLDSARAATRSQKRAKDLELREESRPFYQKLPKTREWAENNYYQIPIADQNYSLVPVSEFWNDFAKWNGEGEFLSENVAEASRNFTEIMLALAVTGLPFEAGEHTNEEQGGKMVMTAASPAIVFHKEIVEASPAEEKTPILVSENFFRLDDRYRHENNQRFDKFVTDEFLIDVVYGSQIVVTNPTSSPQRLDLLVQIPQNAIPVQGSDYTRSYPFNLGPYSTQKLEYHFYFPEPCDAIHYPVQVCNDRKVVAYAEPFTFHVVKELSSIDKRSWEYISQHGSEEAVLGYLRSHNLQRTKLDRIAWRMRAPAFFGKVTGYLRDQFAYDGTLWLYGLMHQDLQAIRDYFDHADAFLARCGAWLNSDVLSIDPVERRVYQFLEYKPLVNARSHQLGAEPEIQNEALLEQYRSLLRILSCKAELDDEDLMSVTYYLLLQDRIAEAMDFFARVNPENLPTKLQYDYFSAYIAFYKQEPETAKRLAEKYADYPVDRWKELFAQISAQVDEIEAGVPEVVDEKDRSQRQERLASTEPGFDVSVESGMVTIKYRNLDEVTVNYYLMDLELLFSTNPFVSQDTSRFSMIQPTRADVVKLPKRDGETSFPLPEEFRSSNVLIEVIGAGIKNAQAYYANTLNVQIVGNYGVLEVSAADSGNPLPVTYVKVYAKMKNGEVRFFKDGYTDLRGKFDYVSLNTDELPDVEKFSILVMSEENGAIVRETKPPRR